MSYAIKRVVVIGSGTMGGGIAAQVANAGIPVYLLDVAPTELTPEEEKRGLKLDHPKVRNRIVAASLDRLKKSKPAAFFTPQAAEAATLLDSALGCAINSMMPADKTFTTLEMKVNYLRPIRRERGVLRCEANVIHAGGRVATAEGRITNEGGKLYAHGTATCILFRP